MHDPQYQLGTCLAGTEGHYMDRMTLSQESCFRRDRLSLSTSWARVLRERTGTGVCSARFAVAPTWVVESICVVPCDHGLPNPTLLSQPEVLDVTLILVPRQPVKLVTMEECLEDGNVSQIEFCFRVVYILVHATVPAFHHRTPQYSSGHPLPHPPLGLHGRM